MTLTRMFLTTDGSCFCSASDKVVAEEAAFVVALVSKEMLKAITLSLIGRSTAGVVVRDSLDKISDRGLFEVIFLVIG